MNLTPFEFLLHPMRPGSQVVRVYNDGLTGLLYDQGEEEAIRDAGPQVLFGAGADLFDDEATMTLLREGRLLVYGMHEDNEIAMEVIVGEPLTEAELARGEWLQDGPCHIDLPSGRLAIHSYNSLPIGDFEPGQQDPGGLATVEPGRYHARLYRKEASSVTDADYDNLGEGGYAYLSANTIIDVLVLTPFAAGETLPEMHNVLFGDCIDFAPENAVEA